MLCIEKVSSQHVRKEERHEERKEPSIPTKEYEKENGGRNMEQQSEQRIPMPSRTTDERSDTHAEDEHREVSEEHVQRAANCEINGTVFIGRIQEFLLGHDGIRADACTEQFGIVGVMVIVRAFPNTGWGNHVKPENGENQTGENGLAENGMVLIVVEDDKEARQQQRGKHAEHDSTKNIGYEISESTHDTQH